MEIKHISPEGLKNLTNEFQVILFHAFWCTNSKNLKAEIKKIEDNSFNFLAFDIDKDISLANQFKINITPTLIILKNKKVLSKRSDLWTKKNGVIKSTIIQEWINSFKSEEL